MVRTWPGDGPPRRHLRPSTSASSFPRCGREPLDTMRRLLAKTIDRAVRHGSGQGAGGSIAGQTGPGRPAACPDRTGPQPPGRALPSPASTIRHPGLGSPLADPAFLQDRIVRWREVAGDLFERSLGRREADSLKRFLIPNFQSAPAAEPEKPPLVRAEGVDFVDDDVGDRTEAVRARPARTLKVQRFRAS